MGKRNNHWNKTTHLRYINEGRGKGDLADYRPWLTTHDFPSEGKVVRILGQTTGRIHHLMSQAEKYFFLALDFDPSVTDIKEQYPLPLDKTLLIAAELGIRHPEKSGYPFVMTTDFYFCRNGHWNAATIKPSSKLDDKRTMEKFAIEREYYKRRGIPWSIVTEKEINRDYGDNIYWLRSGASIEELIPSLSEREKILDVFEMLYHDDSIPFTVLTECFEEECGLRPGAGLQIFKHLVVHRRIDIDLTKRIDSIEPRSSIHRLYF